MRIKMGTVVPKMGTFVHLIDEPIDYRKAVAMALHEEFGATNRAIKVAMRWTGASERTVKYWLADEDRAAISSSRWRGTPMPCCSCFSRLRDAMWWKTKTIEGRALVRAA